VSDSAPVSFDAQADGFSRLSHGCAADFFAGKKFCTPSNNSHNRATVICLYAAAGGTHNRAVPDCCCALTKVENPCSAAALGPK
jgi:hypothetical protein